MAAPDLGNYPTTVSGRKLLDQYGNVHLIRSSSSWGMAQNCPNADIPTAIQDMVDRGFNSVSVCPCGLNFNTGWVRYQNMAGQPFFATTNNGTTPSTPFASELGAAWGSMDLVVSEALSHGMTVLFTMYTGYHVGSEQQGFEAELIAAGPTNAYNTGLKIGTRYASYPNFIWHHVADYSYDYGDPLADVMDPLFHGLTDGTDRLILAEPMQPRTSYDQFISQNGTGGTGYEWMRISINSLYSYNSSAVERFDETYTETGATTIPAWDCEPPYVGATHYGSDLGVYAQQVRERNYSVIIRGGCGINWGHEAFWGFDRNPLFNTGYVWEQVVDRPETMQAQVCWETLALCADASWVPDNGVLLNFGHQSGETKAASGYSDTAALIYVPTSRSLTVDLTPLDALEFVEAMWIDPGTGARTVLGKFATTGTETFVGIGTNSTGQTDWVLRLAEEQIGELAMGSLPATALKVGTSTAIAAYIGANQVWSIGGSLVWSASTMVVTAIGTSGTWSTVGVWVGSPATVAVTGTSGTWSISTPAVPVEYSLLTIGTVNEPTPPFSTGVFTPSDDSLLVVFCAVGSNTDRVSDLTLTGGGLTYTVAGTQAKSGSNWAQGRYWTAPVTTGASMSIAFSAGIPAFTNGFGTWAVYEVTGHDGASPVGATGDDVFGNDTSNSVNGADSIALTGTSASTSAVLAFIAVDTFPSDATQGVLPGSGWTEDGETTYVTGALSYGQAQSRVGVASTVDWADTNVSAGVGVTWSAVQMAVEIKAGVAAPPGPQTWTGSPGTIAVTGATGVWTGSDPQTWTASAATMSVTATSGSWSTASSGLSLTLDAYGGGGYQSGTGNPSIPVDLPDWAVTSGQLLIVGLGGANGNSSGNNGGPYFALSGGGLTWTRVASEPTATYIARTAIFYAFATSTTTITNMTASTNDWGLGIHYAMYRASGAHATPIGATATGNAATTDGIADITLSGTPAASSIILGVHWENTADANATKSMTHGVSDGWTEDFDMGPALTATHQWGVWMGQHKTGHTITRVRVDDVKPAGMTAVTYSYAGTAIEIKTA